MTRQTREIARPAIPAVRPAPLTAILRKALIWNRAWQECRRLRRLDDPAIRDMGMTRADRDSMTVRQIAARMRG